MKLHYFKDPLGNFGDDLNPWMWPRLLPGVLDEDGSELLVGIGTLINHRLPALPLKHIMGSGAGYGDRPALDATYRFHAVRGYDTARLLGVPEDRVITDAAVLVRTMPMPAATMPRARAGVLITGHTLAHYDWQQVCERAGLVFISCHWSVERVLAEILRCDVLLAEAMHGAIVADALRVPWLPIACSDNILPFKWRDWLGSVRLPYEPVSIPTLHGRQPGLAGRSKLKAATKQLAAWAGYWNEGWGERPHPPSSAQEVDEAVRQLEAASRGRSWLSDESLLESHTSRFLECLDLLRAQHHA